MSTKSLSSKELRKLSLAAAELYKFRSRTDLGHATNFLVSRFVVSEYTMGWDADMRSPQDMVIYASKEGVELGLKLAPVYSDYVARNPKLTSHNWDPNYKGQTKLVREIVPLPVLERTGYFDEYARPGSCERQIMYFCKSPGSRTRALTCNRNGREFSAKEKSIVEFLAPHLQSAYENCLAFEAAERQVAKAAASWQAISLEMIWLDQDHLVHEITARVPSLVKEFLGQEMPLHRLPNQLMDWLRASRVSYPAEPIRPMIIRRENATLKIRYYPDQLPGLNLLTFHRQTVAPEFENFRSLGLTRREGEVLHWVSQGKTNDEIGIILGISGLTIKKHVENLFAKLGVNNRVALATIATSNPQA